MQDKFYLSGQLSEDSTQLIISHGRALAKVLHAWQGKELSIVLSKMTRKRTDRQNRYLHGVIVPIVQNLIYQRDGIRVSVSKAKAFIYTNVLEREIEEVEILGRKVIEVREQRFSTMSTVQFSEAVKTVQKYFAEHFGVDIPDPKENNTADEFFENTIYKNFEYE